MSRFMVLLAAVTSLLVPGIARAQTGPILAQASDMAAVRQVLVDYQNAIVAGDLEAWMALWAPGAIRMPPGRPAIVGLDAIRATATVGKAEGKVAMDIQQQEINLMGDWAYSRGVYTVTITGTDGTVTSHVDGKFFTTLQRQPDGSWKIYRDIFNSNVPPA